MIRCVFFVEKCQNLMKAGAVCVLYTPFTREHKRKRTEFVIKKVFRSHETTGDAVVHMPGL